MMQATRFLRGAIILGATVLALFATKAHAESEDEERRTDWSEPRRIAVPTNAGKVSGVVRLRRLPEKEKEGDDEKDPRETRLRDIEVKSLFIPKENLLWVGASGYESFFVVKDKIAALYPTAGADLSISIVNAAIPKTGRADKALSEELNIRFKKLGERPLRYQYWISLRKLFGQDAFADEQNPRAYSVPKISEISFDRGNAIITLVEKNARKSTVTFNEDLQVIAASREGQPIAVNTPVTPQKLTADKD
jgi:hypothetical protein